MLELQKNPPPTSEESAYLSSPGRTLYEACIAVGHDKNGRACPSCPLHDLCEREWRRHVKQAFGVV